MTTEDEKAKSFPNKNSYNFIKFKQATMIYTLQSVFSTLSFKNKAGTMGIVKGRIMDKQIREWRLHEVY